MFSGRITFTIFKQQGDAEAHSGHWEDINRPQKKWKQKDLYWVGSVASHLALWVDFLVVTLVSDDATSYITAHP